MILHNSIRVTQDLSRRNPYAQINCVRLTYGHRDKGAQYLGSVLNNVKRGLEVPTNNVESCEYNHPSLRGAVHSIAGSNPVQPFGSSLASLRWRRLISPRKAATINCPVLSPASFTFSISSITSCGTREAICVDLLLLRPVAMTIPRCIRCLALYTKEIEKKGLRWLAPLCKVVSTLVVLRVKNSEARQCGNTNRASYHQDS